jgi:uncharacterized protein (TIGR03083 family)
VDNLGDRLDEPLLLVELQRGFQDSIDLVDPKTPIPWCAGWRVVDLVEHLSWVHHWAAAMARSVDVEPSDEGTELRLRYATSAAELATTLQSLDPSAPARTLVEGGTVAFWYRRQLHETLIHLWDLRTAGGLDLVVAPDVWADTVDEVVTVMHPRQVRLGRAPVPSVRLALGATDVDRDWSLSAADEVPSGRTATVLGPAEALALLLWRRIGLDDHRLRVRGDVDALAAVLDDHLVP